MAKIDRLLVGESLVGDGNEVAHIDLIIGPRGSAAESAFANALTNNKDGFTSLLAVVAPNLLVKPATVKSALVPGLMRAAFSTWSQAAQSACTPVSWRRRQPCAACMTVCATAAPCLRTMCESG